MVDWGTQDRLYPAGYQQTDIRNRRTSIDSSLPYSVASNRRHNCSLKAKQTEKLNNNKILIENLSLGLNQAFQFFEEISSKSDNDKKQKLLATYSSDINWPRSVCCLAGNDGSLVVCEQERCRLLLFTSQLILRSTCGGKRGDGQYEFDSPWSVASFLDGQSLINVIVADTNNRRIQVFIIGYDGEFLHKHSLSIKEKPYFITTNNQYFAVSCEKGIIKCFLVKNKREITTIELNKTIIIPNSVQSAFPICIDNESSFLFISSSSSSVSNIYQLTINGEYLRTIQLVNKPFLHISSLIYDNTDQLLVIVDSINSVIYTVDPDLDEYNMKILFKRSGNVNFPQGLCIGNEGHLIIVECSLTTQHALKVFRYHPCSCHSRLMSSSLKISETTSVRSFIFPY